MGQLLGTASDLEHHSAILYPSAKNPDRADQVWISVIRGLRRVRPGLPVRFDTVHSTERLLTVTGQPVEGLRGLLLEQFCSKPLPRLEVTHFGDRARYTISGDGVALRSAVHLLHATL